MSIIELMMTITIVSILAAVATPSFTKMVQDARIRSQSSDLQANLAIARAEAAKRSVRVTLCPSTSYNAATPACTGGSAWGSGYIIFADASGNGVYNAAADILIMVSEPLAGGNTLTSTGFNGVNAAGTAITDVLQFRPSGVTNLPAAGVGTFALSDSRTGQNVCRQISIGATGRAVSATVTCP
jgi:type IV fimbrial biogenesis protein FimT